MAEGRKGEELKGGRKGGGEYGRSEGGEERVEVAEKREGEGEVVGTSGKEGDCQKRTKGRFWNSFHSGEKSTAVER